MSKSIFTQVVFSTFLFEQIQLLKALQSVDGQLEISQCLHAKLFHGILKLDIMEDNDGNVVCVLFSKHFVWLLLDGGQQLAGVSDDSIADFSAQLLGVLVSLALREAHSE